MKLAVLCLAALSCQAALAQVAPFGYRLGTVPVTEDANGIVIGTRPPVHVRILPGGHTWPLLALDETGTIRVGDRVLESGRPDGGLSSAPGRPDERSVILPHGYRVTVLKSAYRLSRGRDACTFAPRDLGLAGDKDPLEALKYGNLVFRAADSKLLALSTRLGAEKSATTYSTIDIDLGHCRVHRTNLGNPDLLVELNRSSRGGWWVTGSIEQTLLQSKNGRDWHPVPLPEGLSSLVSAYIVDPDNIWLAGMLPASLGDDDAPLLIHSGDGGRRWTNVSRSDPLLKTLPAGWLEGWRRLGRPLKR